MLPLFTKLELGSNLMKT